MVMPTPRALLWLTVAACSLSVFGCGSGKQPEQMTTPKASSQPSPAAQQGRRVERESFVGVWRLEPGDDLVEAARKLGRDVPSMELEAYEDGTFDLVGRVGEREFEVSGEWFVAEREVTLRAREVSGDAPILKSETEPRGGTLSEDGNSFVDAAGWVWRRATS